MRKQFIALCIVTAFLLTACGEDSKVIEGEVNVVRTDGADTKGVEEQAEQRQETSLEKEAEESGETYKGYVFLHNNIVMEIDAEAAPVIEGLGEANAYFEAPSCAFEGIDKMYTYTSFEIDTYPVKGVDYISAIVFKDDSIVTGEGVGIGDPLEKVFDVYGETDFSGGGMLTYEKDGMELKFIIKDDSVASVEYRSTVLDE